jgi:hypothetical protein
MHFICAKLNQYCGSDRVPVPWSTWLNNFSFLWQMAPTGCNYLDDQNLQSLLYWSQYVCWPHKWFIILGEAEQKVVHELVEPFTLLPCLCPYHSQTPNIYTELWHSFLLDNFLTMISCNFHSNKIKYHQTVNELWRIFHCIKTRQMLRQGEENKINTWQILSLRLSSTTSFIKSLTN